MNVNARAKSQAAYALLTALWLVCVYRAVTQSIVHDEAYAYETYVIGPASELFNVYLANHHFLQTVAMRLSFSVFGLSEWALRLPTLAAAALYFAMAYRLSRSAFGTGWRAMGATALLVLNPFVLDFMVAARGYGMALAFLFWAIAVLFDYFHGATKPPRGELAKAGLALSLSVMSNLVFAFPAAALAGFTLIRLAQVTPGMAELEPPRVPGRKRQKTAAVADSPARRRSTDWTWFAAPIAILAILFFLVFPIEKIRGSELYAGNSSLADCLRDLVSVSLQHGGIFENAGWMAPVRDTVAFIVAPALIVGGLAVGLLKRDLLLTMTGATAAGSALLIVAAHLAAGVRYPVDRTGIYFLALVALALAGLIRCAPRTVAAAGVALAAIVLALFIAEFDTRKFIIWEYDADTQQLAQRLAAAVASSGAHSASVALSWQLEPSLNFYRDKGNWTWTEPFERKPIGTGADYYALIPQNQAVIEPFRLSVTYKGPVSGTVLAVPRP
jgi:hypothetical protein